MTVSNTKNSVSWQGTGNQTRFDFAFKIPAGTSVVTLVETLAEGGYKIETLDASHYVITGEDDPNGGYVTLAKPPKAGLSVTIRRVLPLTQETDLVTGAGFYPESVEAMVDESRMIDQQLAEGLSRAVQIPAGVDIDPQDYFEAMTATGNAATAAAESAAESAQNAAISESEAADSAAAALQSENSAACSAEQAKVEKIEWRGAWDEATSYAPRQAVYYEGSSWIATALNKDAPPGDNASWEMLAMAGARSASATIPKMDGIAAIGEETLYARGDHVHPAAFTTREIITASGPWTAQRTGWHRVRRIGGGGAGGGIGLRGGSGGGNTKFGGMIAARGGGGGNGGHADTPAGAGGGGAGEILEDLIWLGKGDIIHCIIGAGGICSTTNMTAPTGYSAPVFLMSIRRTSGMGAIGAQPGLQGYSDSGGAYGASGGSGGSNGTGFGGGGGGASGYGGSNVAYYPSPGGAAIDGGMPGDDSNSATHQGGAGGPGAIIIEY